MSETGTGTTEAVHAMVACANCAACLELVSESVAQSTIYTEHEYKI